MQKMYPRTNPVPVGARAKGWGFLSHIPLTTSVRRMPLLPWLLVYSLSESEAGSASIFIDELNAC